MITSQLTICQQCGGASIAPCPTCLPKNISNERIDVRVNKALREAITDKARTEGLSVSAYIRSVLTKALKIYA